MQMDFLENSVKATGKRGSVELITGSMFSGKTEELIRRLRRAQFAGLKVEIFKPSLDKRYSESRILSHDERSILSTPVDHASAILLLAGDVNVIGIDEAQFVYRYPFHPVGRFQSRQMDSQFLVLLHQLSFLLAGPGNLISQSNQLVVGPNGKKRTPD